MTAHSHPHESITMTADASDSGERYRRDIDGLRAIAVLAVIAFHLNTKLLPGGFVGVDIFFVISGYLITKNIATELGAGKFSLLEFYRRRIKRIAPVMLAVIACVLWVGYLVLLPEDLVAMAKSAFWSVGSLANVYFWHEVDTEYFAPASVQLPLLHLWSLGVEEQFYLLWPLLLMLAWRLVPTGARRASALNLALALALVTIPLSVGLAMLGYAHDSRFVYYMLPTRAGELMIGAAAALWAIKHPYVNGGAWRSKTMAWCGAALIALSLLLLNETQPFPGWRAVPPTAGAALLLLAGRAQADTWLQRCLSRAPMVWVGKLSYSLYLWHWPVFAYWRYVYGEPGVLAGAGLLLLTFALAQLSYSLVEQPARHWRGSALRVFALQFAVPGGAVMLVALTLVYGDRLGMPIHSQPYLKQLAQLRLDTRPANHLDWVCQRQVLQAKDLVDSRCVLGPASAQPPQVLLWGDSNAAHYIPMLEVLALQEGFTFRNFAVGSCPTLLGDPAPFVPPDRHAACTESLRLAWPAVKGYPLVIIGASWAHYDQASADFLPRLEASLRSLTAHGQRVVLLAKITVLKDYDGHCLEKSLKLQLLDCSRQPQQLADEVVRVNAKLQALAARLPGVSYFDTNRYLCPQGLCAVYNPQGLPQYVDRSHLNVNASENLGRSILAQDGVPKVLRRDTH